MLHLSDGPDSGPDRNGGKCEKKEANHLVPKAMRGADHGWYYMPYELITLVDQAGSGHVFMVAKELDATDSSGGAWAPVCY